MKRYALLPVLAAAAFACTYLPAPGTPSPTPGGKTQQPPRTQAAEACTPTLPEENPESKSYETVLEEFEVVAPSGNTLYGLIRRPDPAKHPGLCLAAVVLVPGGINPGRTAALSDEAQMLSAAGMVVLTFNAEGRVDSRAPDDKESEGSEDYNGFRGQDGLRAVVEYALALPYVIADNVGIRSQSYGITMAAGCLGRYPELPVKYLVDGEGPPDSYVTCKETWSLDADPSNDQTELIFGILGRYSTERNPSEENIAFWAEREAVRFIGGYRGRYLRLQATWDHAQPPSNQNEVAAFDLPPTWWRNKHAAEIVNAAVAGGVPWVRVNLSEQGNPVNATFDREHPPAYLPGALKDKPWAVRAILEMARMP
jgi:hypothetical protein